MAIVIVVIAVILIILALLSALATAGASAANAVAIAQATSAIQTAQSITWLVALLALVAGGLIGAGIVSLRSRWIGMTLVGAKQSLPDSPSIRTPLRPPLPQPTRSTLRPSETTALPEWDAEPGELVEADDIEDQLFKNWGGWQ